MCKWQSPHRKAGQTRQQKHRFLLPTMCRTSIVCSVLASVLRRGVRAHLKPRHQAAMKQHLKLEFVWLAVFSFGCTKGCKLHQIIQGYLAIMIPIQDEHGSQMRKVQLQKGNDYVLLDRGKSQHIESPAYPPLAVSGADQTKQDSSALSSKKWMKISPNDSFLSL